MDTMHEIRDRARSTQHGLRAALCALGVLLAVLFAGLSTGGCYVDPYPAYAGYYAPGYYGYSTAGYAGGAYFAGGYYGGRYYAPGYYHGSAPFFRGGVGGYGRPIYGAPVHPGGSVIGHVGGGFRGGGGGRRR